MLIAKDDKEIKEIWPDWCDGVPTGGDYMLNPDQLGQKGEAHFKEICSDKKLICNQTLYDRSGWDFIVEFPYQQSSMQSSLDSRHSPISCHVQVKTMWS